MASLLMRMYKKNKSRIKYIAYELQTVNFVQNLSNRPLFVYMLPRQVTHHPPGGAVYFH